MVTADEIFAALRAEFVLTPHGEARGSDPAELFDVDGGPATVGIIASVTRPFCGDCDRVRLTADGQVRNCLFAREESDLRTAMRDGRLRRGARRALGHRDGRQAPGPRHRRRVVPPARPADVGHRRLTTVGPGPRRDGPECQGARTTSLRNPRAPRKSASDVRCSSHASHVLRRSGVCSLGLFHSSCPHGGRCAALGRADSGPSSPGHPAQTSRTPGNERGAGQPRGKPSGTAVRPQTGDAGSRS